MYQRTYAALVASGMYVRNASGASSFCAPEFLIMVYTTRLPRQVDIFISMEFLTNLICSLTAGDS